MADEQTPQPTNTSLTFADTFGKYGDEFLSLDISGDEAFKAFQQKHPEVDDDMLFYLREYRKLDLIEQPEVVKKRIKKKKGDTAPSDAWLRVSIKADGTAAQYLDEDRRYTPLRDFYIFMWDKAHPDATPAEKEAYMSGIIKEPKDALDKLCNFTTERSPLERDIEAAMKYYTKDDVEKYAKHEQSRIYEKAEDDPAYKKALLEAKERTRATYEASKKTDKPLRDEELQQLFIVEQVKSFASFANAHPEKTKAYLANGNDALQLGHTLRTSAGKEEKYLEDDIRFKALLAIKEQQWHQNNPNESSTSEKGQTYFSTITTAQRTDPVDKLTAYTAPVPQQYQEAQAILGRLDPEKMKVFTEAERKRVYADAGHDPAYIAAVLRAKESVKQLYAQRFANGIPLSQEEILREFQLAQMRELYMFVGEHPEKAAAYAKDYTFIASSITLHQAGTPPTESDLDEVLEKTKQRIAASITNPTEPGDMTNNAVSENMTTRIPPTPLSPSSPAQGYHREEIGDDDGEQEMTEDTEPEDETSEPPESSEQEEDQEQPAPTTGGDSGGGNWGGSRGSRLGRINQGVQRVRQLRNLSQELRAAKFVAMLIGPKGQIILWGVIILLLLILFIIIVSSLMALFNSGNSLLDEIPPVTIEKSAPVSVNNGTDIRYTIRASFPGLAQDVIVKDKIPENAVVVSDETTEPFQFDDATNTITWSLREIQGSGSASTGEIPFLLEKYSALGFPEPESPNPRSLEGQAATNWNTRFREHAVKAAQLTGTDVGIIGTWMWLENSFNPYAENCDKEHNTPKGVDEAHDDGDPNTWCPHWGVYWQVAGLHPSSNIDFLLDAFSELYGGVTSDKIKEVGQRVIEDSAERSGTRITILPEFPEDVDLRSTIAKAKQGDKTSRLIVTTLMKDDAIAAYNIGRFFARSGLNQDFAARIDAYDGDNTFYTKQDFVNRAAAIYAGGVTGQAVTAFGSYNLTLTLRPLDDDTFVTNQAHAQVLGAIPGIGGDDLGPTPLPGNELPTENDCNGTYTEANGLGFTDNPLSKNFGDPACSLANGTSVDKDKIQAKIEELDPEHVNEWMNVVIPCTSQFNPNKFTTDGSGKKLWGLLQMGEGQNGSHDYGNVPWERQLENAIRYNNDLRQTPEPNGTIRTWRYWPCASSIHGKN